MEFRFGDTDDVDSIVELSARVQDALTKSGSLQKIGPLSLPLVETAVNERRCHIIEGGHRGVIGCAFVKDIKEDYFHQTPDFDITGYPKPWVYLHSIMLAPEVQGRRIGLQVVQSVVKHIDGSGGTLFLDCWAGNNKLISFYERAGFQFVATVPEEDYEIAVYVRSLTEDYPSSSIEPK